MNQSIKLLSIIFNIVIALFTLIVIPQPLKAETVDSLQQAAQKVIEDDSAKEQFGKSMKGNLMLDRAKTEASKNLSKLAKTEEQQNLPQSKKLFLKNLMPEPQK